MDCFWFWCVWDVWELVGFGCFVVLVVELLFVVVCVVYCVWWGNWCLWLVWLCWYCILDWLIDVFSLGVWCVLDWCWIGWVVLCGRWCNGLCCGCWSVCVICCGRLCWFWFCLFDLVLLYWLCVYCFDLYFNIVVVVGDRDVCWWSGLVWRDCSCSNRFVMLWWFFCWRRIVWDYRVCFWWIVCVWRWNGWKRMVCVLGVDVWSWLFVWWLVISFVGLFWNVLGDGLGDGWVGFCWLGWLIDLFGVLVIYREVDRWLVLLGVWLMWCGGWWVGFCFSCVLFVCVSWVGDRNFCWYRCVGFWFVFSIFCVRCGLGLLFGWLWCWVCWENCWWVFCWYCFVWECGYGVWCCWCVCWLVIGL